MTLTARPRLTEHLPPSSVAAVVEQGFAPHKIDAMATFPEGRAVIYCEAAFGTTTGKTANGLVRRSRRYDVVAVIDSTRAGSDAGQVLDGRPNGVAVVA